MQPRIGPRIALAALACAGLIAGGVWLARAAPRPGAEAVAPSGSEAPRIEAPALEVAAEAGHLAEGRAPATAAAADSSGPAAKDLVLLLVGADGAPLPDVELLLVGADEEAQRATTDAEGRARFEPRAGSGAVYFQVPAYMPQRRELELAAGERRIALDPGAEVSGWVTVDGAVPERALELTLTSDYAVFAGLELPAEVASFLGLGRERLPLLTGASDARGGFAFRGLPEDWSGAIRIPISYALREDLQRVNVHTDHTGAPVALQEPVRNLAIDLVRLPHLTGRLLAADGTAPDRRGWLGCTLESSAGARQTWVMTDAAGRFEIMLIEDDLIAARIDVRWGSGTAIVRRTREEIGSDLDLGDILLAEHAGITFRALDPSGAPIAGALGQVDAGGSIVTTGEAGTASLQAPVGRARLYVGAAGYSVTEMEVDVPSPEPLDVTLAPTNRLSIVLEGSPDLPVKELRVVLESGSASVLGGPESPHGLFWALSRQSYRDSDHSVSSHPDADGRVVLQDLAVGTTLTVRVLDVLGNELMIQSITPLSREEQREVVLHLSHANRSIVGTVRDSAGRALPGVNVMLSDTSWTWTGCRTDSTGSYAFVAVAAERVDLQARLPGFATATERGVALTEARTEVNFVLERGRAAKVAVIDELGRPVDSGQVWAALGDDPPLWYADRLEPGQLELRDLPSGELRLELRLAGARYAGRLASNASSTSFSVPVHGKIEAWWSLSEGQEPREFCMRALSQSADALQVDGWLGAGGSASDAKVVLFPAVLPGTYDLTLGLCRGGDFLPMSEPQTVVVERDSTATVTLRL